MLEDFIGYFVTLLLASCIYVLLTPSGDGIKRVSILTNSANILYWERRAVCETVGHRQLFTDFAFIQGNGRLLTVTTLFLVSVLHPQLLCVAQ